MRLPEIRTIWHGRLGHLTLDAGRPTFRKRTANAAPSTETVMGHWHFVVVGITFACVTGCASEPSVSQAGVDTLPSGTVIVHNSAHGLWDSATAWRVVQDLQLGPAEDGPAAFSSVGALAVDGRGRIYVLDRQSLEVRLFAADGRYLRTIGRKGGGPGEFKSADGITVDHEDRLWVGDRAGRFSVFDTSGTFITDYRRAAPRGSYARMLSGGASGVVWDQWSIWNPDGPGRTELLRFEVGQYPDTVRFPPFEQPYWQLTTHEGSSTNTFRFSVPFTARELIAPAPAANVWRAISGEYRLTRFSPDGDSILVVTREYHPVPVSTEERERALAPYRTRLAGSNTDLDESLVPAHHPALHGMLADDRGYLWAAPVSSDTTRLAFDVFDPEGRYLGGVATTMTPRMLSPRPVLRNGCLYYVGADDLDVPYVARLKIVAQ